MGKASSAKKVARAAGLGGGRAYGQRPAWNYYFAVLVLVVLGVAGVYNSREYHENKVNAAGNTAPKVGQSPAWLEGYAVDACGKLLPPVKASKDPFGIYTTGDGIIRISPTAKSAAGHNATLAKFASAVGMTLNAGQLQVPGGHPYVNGDTCEGKPGHVYVMTWPSPQAPASDGVLQTKKEVNQANGYEDTCDPDCDSGVLLENDQLVTIAFLPAPAKGHSLQVLKPPASVVVQLSKLIAAGGTSTTLPATPTTAARSTNSTATTSHTTPTSHTSPTSHTTPTSHATATTKPAKSSTSSHTAHSSKASKGAK